MRVLTEEQKERKREYNKRHYLENKKRINARHRAWYHENRDERRRQGREYYLENLAAIKEKRDSKKDQIGEYQKKYYLRNRAKKLAYAKKYALENGDKIIQRGKRYYIHQRQVAPWLFSYNRAYNRCNNQNDDSYKWYGGRGIKINITRDELSWLWMRDGACTLNKPSLDRIDPDGDYELSNCRFIELSENVKRSWERRRNSK